MKAMADGTVTMTFSEYDMYEEAAAGCGYTLSDWYPTMADAVKMAEDFADNVLFIIWILSSNPDRELDGEERKVQSFLSAALRHKLILKE